MCQLRVDARVVNADRGTSAQTAALHAPPPNRTAASPRKKSRGRNSAAKRAVMK
jgi:hypothetical protein